VGVGGSSRKVFEITDTDRLLIDGTEGPVHRPERQRVVMRPPRKRATVSMRDRRADEATDLTITREMNEWTVEDVDARRGSTRELDLFLCECGDASCSDPDRPHARRARGGALGPRTLRDRREPRESGGRRLGE
jgi:hypothetical protein